MGTFGKHIVVIVICAKVLILNVVTFYIRNSLSQVKHVVAVGDCLARLKNIPYQCKFTCLGRTCNPEIRLCYIVTAVFSLFYRDLSLQNNFFCFVKGEECKE